MPRLIKDCIVNIWEAAEGFTLCKEPPDHNEPSLKWITSGTTEAGTAAPRCPFPVRESFQFTVGMDCQSWTGTSAEFGSATDCNKAIYSMRHAEERTVICRKIKTYVCSDRKSLLTKALPPATSFDCIVSLEYYHWKIHAIQLSYASYFGCFNSTAFRSAFSFRLNVFRLNVHDQQGASLLSDCVDLNIN